MTLYLGIDAGGTFTRCTLYNQEGVKVESHQFESLHFMRVGYAGITRVLKEVHKTFEASIAQSKLEVVIGTAGYGQDQIVRENIEQSIYSVFPQAIIMNDAQLAMISALENKDGIFVISGTGSIAFRQHDHKTFRQGGWGYLLDDEGSAFDIGKKVIKAFVDMADGRIEETSMFTHIMETLMLKDPYELIAYINHKKEDYRQCVAGFAKMIYPCAQQGDEVALAIYRVAGETLASLVRGFGVTGEVVSYGGSVLLHNQYVRDSFKDAVKDYFVLKEPIHSPEYAAYLISNEES